MTSPRTEAKLEIEAPEYHLDDHISYLVNRVGSGLATLFSEEAKQFELSMFMWRVLTVLIDRGEQRLIDLAELTSIESSTLSRVTDAMQKRRIISRVRSRSNRRELVISATNLGREIACTLIPAAGRIESLATEGISAEDIETTKQTLRRMYLQLKGHLD